jgi:membrane dipeptidase
VSLLGAPFFNRQQFALFGEAGPLYPTSVIDLVRGSTVVDMLSLLTLDYKKLITWQLEPEAFRDADFERLRNAGVTILHPAVGFVEGDVYTSSVRDLTRWNFFLAGHSQQFLRIDRPSDIALAKASGKIGIVLGLQNSQHFRTLEDVDAFYSMGQRISQLTYFNNRLGGGSTDPKCGLSPFGAAIVERMNSLGMAVDVSHCSDRTTLDAMDASRKPVLVTHSNCRALVPSNTRCKTDEAIRKLAAGGGVIGVTMVRPFVRSSGAATIEDVLNHMDHVVSIAGIDHVGLGTDVDLDGREGGVPRTSDLDGVRYTEKIFALTQGLLRRKYSRTDIQLILGGNFSRALNAVWAA